VDWLEDREGEERTEEELREEDVREAEEDRVVVPIGLEERLEEDVTPRLEEELLRGTERLEDRLALPVVREGVPRTLLS
jgi:hypothetical protein